MKENAEGPSPRGLIFDFDGTLADTMPIHWEAWQVVIDKYGVRFDEQRFYALGGVPARDILSRLADEQGLSFDPLEAAADKAGAYLARLDRVRPIERALGIVREHHGSLPLAIATGGSRGIVQQVLEYLDMAHFFDAVVTNEDVVNQKPAPDIFLEAARRIGVAPRFCRAFEDTDLGMQAIRAAGMEAVDVREWLVEG